MASLFAIIVLLLASQDPEILGSWRGTSLCVDKTHFPACNDEQVIYDVSRHGSARDTVTLRADKIVNGEREFMGEFDFARTRDSSWVAYYQNPRVRIRITLRIHGAEMTGRMVDERSELQVRQMALTRVT